MRTNPGGQLTPPEVLGRDALIERLWRVLDRQSVVLTAERRLGKTSVIRKMVAQAPADKLAVYHDLEALRSPLEFVETVFRDVESYLGRFQRTTDRVRLFLSQLPGAEVAGVKFPQTWAPHWKALLTRTVEDLVQHQERTVVFFWDEVPLMLHNIRMDLGETAAMELLDALRALRQMHPAFRMVFTGSIGLPNVIGALRKAGYANDPTNDMLTVDVPALDPSDATDLARRLLEGEGLTALATHDVATVIADALDGLPYFIHHFIEQLAMRKPAELDASVVGTMVDACLGDAQDHWDLAHYRERIDTYYETGEHALALALLDALAVAELPSFDDICQRVRSQLTAGDDEAIRGVLTLLQRDHYVVIREGGRFSFRYPLIRRYWRLHRGLAA